MVIKRGDTILDINKKKKKDKKKKKTFWLFDLKQKRASYLDLFIFMLTAFTLVVVLGMIIYTATTTTERLKELTGHMTDRTDVHGENITTVIDYSLGEVVNSYQALYWISVLLIVGMILSIFIGSYMVTTKPVFFIPYFFILLIALVISVVISNAYENIISDPLLIDTFVKFWGSNYILLYLPMWITIIGFTGAIIMYSNMAKARAGGTYGY